MRMVHWKCSNTKGDKVRNEDIHKKKCKKIDYDGLVMYDINL